MPSPSRIVQDLLLLLLPCIIINNVLASSLATAIPHHVYDIGNNFELSWHSNTIQLFIRQNGKTIWATVPDQPFLSASAGNDSLLGANGNFNILQIDVDECQKQNVTQITSSTWDGSINGKSVAVNGHLLDCGNRTAEYSFHFWVPIDLPDRIAFNININLASNSEKPLNKLYLKFGSDASEDFYGLGAQASFASLKNQSIPIFSREQGAGRGDEPITSLENAFSYFAGGNQFTTYTAIPQYISTAARVFYLGKKNTAYANFDFREPDAVTIRYDSLSVDGQFMQASNMLNAVTMLTNYTGRMPTLPRWVDNGAILGIQGGQDKVNKIVQQGLEIDCPIAGVWLQDWSGTHIQRVPIVNVNISRVWWNWETDTALYPNRENFVQSLRDQHNVRTLTYINPFLANVSTKSDGFHRNLFLEATEGRYMVQNATTNSTSIVSSGPGIDAGIIDLTNSFTRKWFTDVLRTQVWNANISGFMCDFGEYTPVTSDTKLANITADAFFYHNQYPRDWASFQHSIAEDTPLSSEVLIFHRSATFATNKYMNLFWAGDQNVAWSINDGIKSVVTILGHMGMSGYAQGHSDIGGYTTTFAFPPPHNSSGAVPRSAELLGRWGELAAVSSAVFRSHEGSVPYVNAQFYSNASTYTYFAYNARLFKSMGRYRRRILETEGRELGWPLLRMPVFYHPDDMRAREISYQSFYLGPDLYVAPVLDPAVEVVQVYLPGKEIKQKYTHVWSGKIFEGGQTIEVAAPYGKPAVFLVDCVQNPYLEDFLDFVSRENDTLIAFDSQF